jgi:hypothetical protein
VIGQAFPVSAQMLAEIVFAAAGINHSCVLSSVLLLIDHNVYSNVIGLC